MVRVCVCGCTMADVASSTQPRWADTAFTFTHTHHPSQSPAIQSPPLTYPHIHQGHPVIVQIYVHISIQMARTLLLLNISVSIDQLLCESNIYISKTVVSLILLYSTTYSSHQCSSKQPFRSSRSSEKRCRSLFYLARLTVSYFGAHPIVLFKC